MLKEIYLKDFRNYHEERISLEPGINVVYGENGQGKTNLLEAVYFALRGKGFRSGGNRDLVREGAEAGVVIARIVEKEIERSVARQVCRDGTMRTKVDGKEARSAQESVVIFTQDDLAVIKGDPQQRRDFLDDLGSDLDREFAECSGQFKKALHQRNETLKRIRKGEGGREALPAWEEILADRGWRVVERRKELLGLLESGVNERMVPQGEGSIAIRYYGTFEGREDYRLRLEKNRDREIARGMTVTGPHRDEVIFLLDGRNLKTKGSQGQQRKTMVLLKLACAELMDKKYKKRGIACLLLLDDLASELDAHNTAWLTGMMREREQVIITVNSNRLAEIGGVGRSLRIEGGRLS